MKNIKDVDLNNKRAIVRVDYNVPHAGEKIIDSTRILKTKPTIELLKIKNAKIVLLSHLGRPHGVFDPAYSLKFMVPFLEECFSTRVTYYPDLLDPNALALSKDIQPKEILLFDNIRFYKEEEENNEEFSKRLASLGDIYANDAFSCSHRAHASIVGITKYLPSFPGLFLEEEESNLGRLLDRHLKPVTAIIAGKKVSTKFKALKHLDSFVDNIIIGGAMANTFLKSQGYDIGSSYYEKDFVDAAFEFLQTSRSIILIPTDVVIAKGLEVPSQKTNIVTLQDTIPPDHCIFDLGPITVSKICDVISTSKLVLWNGPLGLFEDPRFKEATGGVAKFIAQLTKERKIQSIIGGGDTVAALKITGVVNDFTYISTAGGAFLEWLEGEELPGIKALKENGITKTS